MFNKANEIVGQFINSNSVVSKNENWNTSKYISVKKGSTICWSYETVGAGQLTINEFNDAESFIKQTSADYRNNNGNELVVTLLNDTSYVRVGYRNNLTCDNLVLEYGNKRSGFREYKESQTYTIPTQQPMRSIGDVRDCFVKKDDGWYERHYIGQKILDGSENGWGFSSSGEQNINVANISISSMLVSNFGLGLCNYFIRGTSKIANTLRFGANDSQLCFYIKSTDFANINDWKTWLSNNNVEVIYVLETPVDLPCTQAQIDVLENMPSTYKEMTIINSEDETEAYLEVSGIYDLNNLINN